jgi:glycosyltransferase involved in cell wall biosynthesis
MLKVLHEVSGGIACSPRLLEQLPPSIPKLLLRGVVGADIAACSQNGVPKQNWVLFSGTHARQYGISSLIEGWEKAALSGWKLHITGDGPETPVIKKLTEKKGSIVFHGLVSREKLVQLMCSAKICINPHELSQTPGNVFAFKIVEYLASGAHVVTTPMGSLERELEGGITYMVDNAPDTIAATLKQVIEHRKWEQGAGDHVRGIYGPAAVSKSLDALLRRVLNGRGK